MQNPFRYFNSSPEVIRLAVMMYVGIVRLTGLESGRVDLEVVPPCCTVWRRS